MFNVNTIMQFLFGLFETLLLFTLLFLQDFSGEGSDEFELELFLLKPATGQQLIHLLSSFCLEEETKSWAVFLTFQMNAVDADILAFLCYCSYI